MHFLTVCITVIERCTKETEKKSKNTQLHFVATFAKLLLDLAPFPLTVYSLALAFQL